MDRRQIAEQFSRLVDELLRSSAPPAGFELTRPGPARPGAV